MPERALYSNLYAIEVQFGEVAQLFIQHETGADNLVARIMHRDAHEIPHRHVLGEGVLGQARLLLGVDDIA